MMRLEQEDLDDPGIANAYKLNVAELKKELQKIVLQTVPDRL